MNNNFIKGMVVAFLIIYVVSPVDFLPGPVDDILAVLLYFAANKRKHWIERKDPDIEVIDTDGRVI